MTERLEIYKCEVCGNIVEVLHSGVGELVCCGQPMKLIEPRTASEEGKEKHVPIIERTEKGVIVKVGSTPHPMEEKHYVEWIQALTEKNVLRKFLAPGEEPKAEFRTTEEIVRVREYCNIHLLWTS
ncbi:MAG: desulfoferrodoxin [Thermoplasmata archaeon]